MGGVQPRQSSNDQHGLRTQSENNFLLAEDDVRRWCGNRAQNSLATCAKLLPTCFTLVAIDETLNFLKKISTDEVRAEFMSEVSRVLSINQVTFVLMTSLTRGDLALALSKSQRKPDWLPHTMLSREDTTALARALCTQDESQWHPCFQVALADVNGIPRYIADVCSKYEKCTPENASTLTTAMLHPTEDTTQRVERLTEDVICACLLPKHFPVAHALLEELCQSGLLALDFDPGNGLSRILIPPFIMARWGSDIQTKSSLGRFLKNMFAVDLI